MELQSPSSVIERLWAKLRSVTPARIGLPRTGSSVATAELLAFQLAHAQAQDAVQDQIDPASFAAALKSRALDPILLNTMATDRHSYLARPDLGRRITGASREALSALPRGYDIVFVLTDGLSAHAITSHALPLLDEVVPQLTRSGWKIGPVAIVEQGRVAVGDEIGELLGAAFDRVILYEDHYLRGREKGVIVGLLRQGLASAARAKEIVEIAGATNAAETALTSTQPGELVLLQADTIDETMQWLRGYLEALTARTSPDVIEQVLGEAALEAAQVGVTAGEAIRPPEILAEAESVAKV